MGFYVELYAEPGQVGHYQERGWAPVYWILWGIAGFALACMGLAAHAVLGDLVKEGTLFDQTLFALILSAVPIHLGIGLKMGLVRRFVVFTNQTLIFGFKVGKVTALKKTLQKSDIKEILLINQRQTLNQAVRQHDNLQYHIRGHWRVIAKTNQKSYVLDKHTEKEALEPLYSDLLAWYKP